MEKRFPEILWKKEAGSLWKKGHARLRGWKKDVETGLAERPDIVELHWAHGSLSAKAIQELAHLSQLGGTSPTLGWSTKP